MNAQALLKQTRDFYTATATALNGLSAQLPDSLKSTLAALKAQLDDSLAKLPPTDQVPAAQEAGWALNALERVMADFTGMLSSINALQGALAAKTAEWEASLNQRIQAALEAQIKEGKIFAKDSVDALLATARTEAGEAARARLQLVSDRKAALAQNHLPLPDAAHAALLEAPEEEFTATQKRVGERVAALAAKGLALNAAPEVAGLVARLAYADTYEQELAGLEVVLKSRPKGAEPMLAAGAAGEKRVLGAC